MKSAISTEKIGRSERIDSVVTADYCQNLGALLVLVDPVGVLAKRARALPRRRRRERFHDFERLGSANASLRLLTKSVSDLHIHGGGAWNDG